MLRIALVPIAVIRGSMRFPVIRAHPAELVLAPVACHVRASAILLDAHTTLGTVLGVHEQVVASLRVVLTLGQPLLDGGTRVGRMVGQ